MIKELYKKMRHKFGKLPKVIIFVSFFTNQDNRTLLVNYVNKLSADHTKLSAKLQKL